MAALILTEESTDPLIQIVVEEVQALGVECRLLSTRHLHHRTMSSSFHPDEIRSSVNGVCLTDPSLRVWWRRGSRPRAEDFDDETDAGVAHFRSLQYDQALRSSISLSIAAGARWMNDPNVEWVLEQNKMLQHHLANLAGLDTPPTLCTDDPGEAVGFAQNFEYVAVKPVSGLAIKTTDANSHEVPLVMYTRRLSRDEFVAASPAVRQAPVLIQPYVEKSHELRVTVVGDAVHAAKIDSQRSAVANIDWRHYDLSNTPHSAVQLGADIESKLLKFMALAGIEFAAIDLVVEPSGRVVFLEANPNGQYGWIELLTGLPISASIAKWLAQSTD